MIDLRHGDMRDVLPTIEADSVHSCVTDPPYHLGPSQGRSSRAPEGMYATMRTGFMGKQWDGGSIAFDPDTWRAVHRVLKPGGYLLAMGGTRTFHRLACAIEDAGFEVRDTIAWVYGSGFPKSLDIGKAIDRAAGVEREDKFEGSFDRRAGPTGNKRCDVCGKWLVSGSPCQCPRPQDTGVSDAARQWNGWGTALKPSMELVVIARRPLSERTVAANVLKHSTGGINVDACRVGTSKRVPGSLSTTPNNVYGAGLGGHAQDGSESGHDPNIGRWPANLVHDSSPEVEAAFAAFGNAPGQQRYVGPEHGEKLSKGIYGDFGEHRPHEPRGDTGTASRFFYTAKADKGDRADSRHPTIKPVTLMQWLVRLVTPPGGTVLDPFAGSGTTGEAAMLEGFDAILIEREAEHAADIAHRQRRWHGGDLPLFAEAAD